MHRNRHKLYMILLFVALLTLAGAGFGAAKVSAEAKAIDARMAYEPLLDKLCGAIHQRGSEDDFGGVTGVVEAAARYDDASEAVKHVGYIIEDISGDGIPELLVVVSANGKVADYVVAVYGLDNQQMPVCLLDGWYRNRYGYLGGGKFFHQGSGGAMNSGFGVYAIARDGNDIGCEEFYFTAPKDNNPEKIGLYHNQSGAANPAISEELAISLDEFWQIAEKLEKRCPPLKFTSFVNFSVG